MKKVRRAAERFHTKIDWLDSRHTFSFGEHYDPRQTGFRDLLVINEDHITAGAGFPTHAHRDMEILSYVLDGALAHRDSMGNGSVIKPGDVQRMSAGTGVRHSEHNPQDDRGTHFLQIWITPERRGMPPSYEQRHYEDAEKKGRLRIVGSRDGRDGSVVVHQDVAIHAALLDAGESVVHDVAKGRHRWVQVVRGAVTIDDDLALEAGDGLATSDVEHVSITAREASEILVFDLV